MRIVIVDDEFMIVRGIREMIHSMPNAQHEVFATTDPDAALQYVLEHRPELLITDVRMAGMNGLELMKHIRSHALDTEIVVVSGYDDFEFVRTALLYKARDYLLKPINLSELYRIINTISWEYTKDEAARADFEIQKIDAPVNAYSNVVQSLIDYIQKNCEFGVTLMDLSECSGMNANYISTLFKKEVGKNFLEYMNDVRVDRAKAYLTENEKMTVQEIALKLGYSNERQFFRMFKIKVGMSPNKYRQRVHLINKGKEQEEQHV